MGRTGSKPGTKGRNWPDAERSTIKPGWRLRRATLAEVKALAAEPSWPSTVVAPSASTSTITARSPSC